MRSATIAPPTLLTLVIEDYFQVGSFSALIPPSHWERFESRLMRNTEAVLEMLGLGDHHATFYACGWIAEHYPEVLRAVVAAGHEIGCQGSPANALHTVPPPVRLQELKRSRQLLEQATGRAVLGHRIGRHWLREQDLWALELVREAGFEHDSSLCPLGREFAHDPGSWTLHHRAQAAGDLIEVPVSTFSLAGWRLPIAGGNYFRQSPDAPLRAAAARWQQQHSAPLVAYFHTWEFDAQQPRIGGAGVLQRLRHYRRLDGMPGRLREWLAARHCHSIGEHLGLQAGHTPVVAAASAAEIVRAPASWPMGKPAPRPARALTLVVPCFNEAESLPYLQRTLQAFQRANAESLELSFVFVDDGSHDPTWALMQGLADTLPRCTLRRHPLNRGIAAALLTGFAAARTELVAVIDADGSFDPAQLPAMLARLTDDVDVVCASPAHDAGTMKNVPRWRAAMSLGVAALYRAVLHQRLTSYTSCLRIYRRSRLAGLALSNGGFSGVAEILGRLDLAGARFVEVPAVLETRLLGHSKIRVLRTVGDHLRLLVGLAACRWLGRPLPSHVTAMPSP